ncbi:transmembrane sensor [Pedobacter sp. UYP24]
MSIVPKTSSYDIQLKAWHMDGFRIKQIFKSYLEGKSTPNETKSVDDWYRKNDAKIHVPLTGDKEKEIQEQIWMQIAPELRNDQVLVPRQRQKSTYSWIKIAASVLLVSTAWLLWYKRDQPVPKQVIAYTNFSTSAGERKMLMLSDGTSLTLNSASTIRVSTDFSTKRNVEILDGEVFFNVKHDVKKPFIIKSGAMTTQVLGTSFSILAYKELNKFSVGVTSGKVGVMIVNHPATMLVNGRQLVYNRRKDRIAVAPLDQHLLDWQKGTLILNDVSFEEMAVLVRKNFNITVSTTDQHLAKQHFTATLRTSMTPEQAVQVIAAIHQKSIKKRRHTIEIY